MDADVPEAVELGADLADLVRDELVVIDEPVLRRTARPWGCRGSSGEVRVPKSGMPGSYSAAQPVDLAVSINLADSSTFSGVIQFDAPAWSSGPHRDGHHFGPIGVSPAVWACATWVWGKQTASRHAGRDAGGQPALDERPPGHVAGRIGSCGGLGLRLRRGGNADD